MGRIKTNFCFQDFFNLTIKKSKKLKASSKFFYSLLPCKNVKLIHIPLNSLIFLSFPIPIFQEISAPYNYILQGVNKGVCFHFFQFFPANSTHQLLNNKAQNSPQNPPLSHPSLSQIILYSYPYFHIYFYPSPHFIFLSYFYLTTHYSPLTHSNPYSNPLILPKTHTLYSSFPYIQKNLRQLPKQTPLNSLK